MKLTQITEESDVLASMALIEIRTYNLWENAGQAIREAALTPDQIKQLFQQIEKDVTAAGGNRTLLGKGKDAAAAVNQAWEDLKTKIQNTGPIKNMDAAYDSAVAKIEAGLGGPDNAINKVIQRYRKFAKEHPIAQSFIYAALIAAAGISGAGLGGAATLGLLKMTDKLLQGEKFSSAAYQGGKTGAMAYAAGQIGKAIRGDQTPAGGAADAATQIKGPRGLASEAERIFREKVANGEVTDYNSYQQGMQDSLDQALQNAGGKMSFQSQDMARNLLRMKLDSVAAQANGGEFSGSGPEKVAAIVKQLGGQVDADKIAQQTSAAAQMAQPAASGAAKAAGNAVSNIDATSLPTSSVYDGPNPNIDDTTRLGAHFAKKAADQVDLNKMVQARADAGLLNQPVDVPQVPATDVAQAAVPDVSTAIQPPKGAGMSADYLNKVISGEHPRPLVNPEQAKAALDWQAQNGGPLASTTSAATDAASQAGSGYSKEYLQKVISGEHPRPMISKEKAQELLGQMSGGETGSPYLDKLNRAAANGVRLRESQVHQLFGIVVGINAVIKEGVWDSIKGAAGSAMQGLATAGHNLTTKVTADKLTKAWQAAGSPTDSEEIKKLLAGQGIDAAVVDTALSTMGIKPTAPATSAAAPAGATARTQVGSQQAKKEVDQAISSIQKVRSRDRQNVVKYAQQKFDGIIKQPATTEGKLFYSKFLKQDI